MQTDLTCLTQGLFTTFFPNTKAGEEAWREIALKTEGTGKIFTIHLKDTLRQLKAAGLSVKKEKTLTKEEQQKELKKIFEEMGELGI